MSIGLYDLSGDQNKQIVFPAKASDFKKTANEFSLQYLILLIPEPFFTVHNLLSEFLLRKYCNSAMVNIDSITVIITSAGINHFIR